MPTIHQKTLRGDARFSKSQLLVVLLEFLIQRLNFRLPRLHLLRDFRDARFQARAADALVRAVLLGFGRLFFDAPYVGVLERQEFCRLSGGVRLHLVEEKKSLTSAANF